MKALAIVSAVILCCSFSFGCGQKDEMDASQELLSLEELSSMKVSDSVSVAADEGESLGVAGLKSLPPSGPYKPSAQEIQTALKNAGYYQGDIDGKIGPMSREAIEDFQKENDLQVDGKVGPKTWALLGRYLNMRPSE